jgi:two-component system LytT family response regulator
MTYKAIIVDDESLAREMLQDMLMLINPDIKIVAFCEDLPEAVKAINKFRPDILFLDVDMPRYKGIDIAEFFDVMDFDVVFTTAHQQYAINAIKLNALDYLLKPLDLEDLRIAINKFIKKRQSSETEIKYPGKLVVNTAQIVHFIDIDKIIYLKAEGAYTKIITEDNEVLSSKNLKFYEEHFEDNSSFLRCHKSYIVNKHKIISLNKVRQEISIQNGDIINVSVDKLYELLGT